MAIELDNEHFQELKELPDFQKRFSVLYLTLDNSEPIIEEAGGSEKYTIKYNVAKNTIEEHYEGETAFERYVGSAVVGIPTDWEAIGYFHGAIDCDDKNGKFLMVYYGDDAPDSMDESLDENTKKVLSDAIDPYSVIDFARDVIDAIRYRKKTS